jgi:hypothetical protein
MFCKAAINMHLFIYLFILKSLNSAAQVLSCNIAQNTLYSSAHQQDPDHEQENLAGHRSSSTSALQIHRFRAKLPGQSSPPTK